MGALLSRPLERGFGTTLGNTLRRVLLSSLPGAAVTSIRVSNVHHEFSAIPDVKEDMTQLILQIKQLRVKLYDGIESARLRLEVAGAGTVTAADVHAPPEVEIINPDLYLFTVDAADAQLEMEMTVQGGRGYSPSDDRGRLPIGELPVDAIFSPIRRVNFDVERARVGQKTNYDKLVLEIWTDGTIPARRRHEGRGPYSGQPSDDRRQHLRRKTSISMCASRKKKSKPMAQTAAPTTFRLSSST